MTDFQTTNANADAANTNDSMAQQEHERENGQMSVTESKLGNQAGEADKKLSGPNRPAE